MHLYRRRALAEARQVAEAIADPNRRQTRDGVVTPDIEYWARAIGDSYARGIADAAVVVFGSEELTGRGREEIAKAIHDLVSR